MTPIFDLFMTRFNDIETEHPFDPEWANGTGYYDHVDLGDEPVGYIAKGKDTAGRLFVVFRTPYGDGIVFQRAVDNRVVVTNLPRKIRQLLMMDNYVETPRDLALLIGNQFNQDNIGLRLTRLNK